MKPFLHIMGIGHEGLESLPLKTYRLLVKAEVILVISLEHPAVFDMLQEGIPCERIIPDRDLTDQKIDQGELIDCLKDRLSMLSESSEVILALPGNPLPEGKLVSTLKATLGNCASLTIGTLTDSNLIERLIQIMAELRSEEGCPWDKEQDHFTLKKYLVEETYEVLDAIDSKNMNNFCEELGDLLLQVVFHARIAEESGEFDFTDVTKGISNKLIRRHPHVFGSVVAESSEEVIVNWEAIKGSEKTEAAKNQYQDYFDIPKDLPALFFAQKTQNKAAKVGFDWNNYEGPLAKIYEELEELKQEIKNGNRIKEELGDILFSIVNLSRFLSLDAEDTLRQGTIKFQKRFLEMLKTMDNENQIPSDLSLQQMDNYWNKVKK